MRWLCSTLCYACIQRLHTMNKHRTLQQHNARGHFDISTSHIEHAYKHPVISLFFFILAVTKLNDPAFISTTPITCEGQSHRIPPNSVMHIDYRHFVISETLSPHPSLPPQMHQRSHATLPTQSRAHRQINFQRALKAKIPDLICKIHY